MLDTVQALALALDPSLILRAQGMEPDAWQRDFLLCPDPRVLLLCSRGAGKSRTTSALALHTALFKRDALVLLISLAQRQSLQLFRYVKQGFSAIGRPVPTLKENETQLELANGSRIIALPGREDTIRSFQGVNLLIIDEAARVPDDLYYSVRPMLGVSRGRLVCLTTPFGQRGFFWQEWESSNPWKRIKVTWRACPRLTPAHIEQERASLGDSWVNQEYECLFTALEGLVYPDFEAAIWDAAGWAPGRPVGGIDFGWRNPFAAVWGALDRDDVLWIFGERYLRQTPLHEHAAFLRKIPGVVWAADPSGATEIAELRSADLKVLRGDNDIRLGIAAVTARLRTGRLRVSRTGCPNLVAESKLYRYPSADERKLIGENPVDDHNHALAALRYLVSRLDQRFIARLRRARLPEGPLDAEALEEARAADRQLAPAPTPRPAPSHLASVWDTDEHLWERL